MKRPDNELIQFVFFGNYFYGLCAVALSIESSLQQRFPLNSIKYHILVFSLTVIFYTKAYITDNAVNTSNRRTAWYARFHKPVLFSQLSLSVLSCILALILLPFRNVARISLPQWVLISVFPVTAFLYYGYDDKLIIPYNLRSIGWLKPFFIGFVWAGLATIYPVLFYCIKYSLPYHITLQVVLLFVKNLMFVAVLCILFDIKDYATDYNHSLKTFVVKTGLRKTIFYIALPLSALGLASFITYAVTQHFSILKIVANTIPFVFLMIVGYSLHRRKSILYYLIIIDGLMLLKAFCGIIAMVYF